jgi:soluble lytic murein transglycosylase
MLVKTRGMEGAAASAALIDVSALAGALFEAALEGRGRVPGEAAGELMRSLLEGDVPGVTAFLNRLESKPPSLRTRPEVLTLRAAALYTLGRFADIGTLYEGYADPSPWDRAFFLAAGLATGGGEGLAGTLQNFFLDRPPGDAQRWAWEKIRDRLPVLIGPGPANAAAGRLAMARSGYGEALGLFRVVLEEDETLFFRYPGMVGDLGRAFQFAPGGGNRGVEKLREWDRRIQGGELDRSGYDIPGIRYLILYYAGRIQRQLHRYSQSSDYFVRALEFTPDTLQSDACIWYILTNSFTEKPGETAALVKEYLPRWHSDSYFADILDRLARYLTANRRWDTLAELFPLIRTGSDGETTAKYAYILGRVLSEGLMPAAGGSSAASKESAEYFRISLEEGNTAFYYRALAAYQLGEPTLPIPEEAAAPVSADFPHRDDVEFILDFFEYGLGDRAFDYIRNDTDRFTTGLPAELPSEELRVLAASFARTGRWAESIRLLSAYINRDGYTISRRDLELYYPRAFGDLVEARAREEGLSVGILFGLIRTESAFEPGIRSRAGALGLTQLMPETALEMAGRVSRRGGPVYAEDGKINLEDPEVNIHLGAVYLRYLMDRTESPMAALLAYNGGIGRFRRWRNAEPSLAGDLFLETLEYNETREYGRKVLAAAAVYGYLYYGMTMEDVVADVYNGKIPKP